MRAARLLQPSPLTPPDAWAADNRRYPASAGLPGPRDPTLTGYMIPFARAVHAGAYRRCVAVTAAQSGKTDGMLDIIGARLDQRPAPILYVGPSQDFITDQFEPRLMALLDEAATLSGKVVRGRRMKKTLKYVAGVRVRLASAASSTALKSDPFALGLVDEYDEMMANIQGRGDPLGLVEARGETYADFVTAITSTPSQGVVDVEEDPVSGLIFWAKAAPETVTSPIWRLWQQGTRHHFAWPCPHCEVHFVPRFDRLKWPKGATPAQARTAAYLECPQCGGVIEDAHKPEMIAGGVQIAPGQTIAQARAGAAVPETATWSCWTSGLCSPFVTFGARAERYVQALASGEPDKIQTVMNAGFGECFSPMHLTAHPEWKDIEKRALPYAQGEIPEGGLRLVAGVDVQRFSLYYVIRAFGARGTSWLVTAGQLLGPTDQDEVWTDLADLILTPIAGMHIEKVGIDSGFRPNKPDGVNEHKVYEFCRRYQWLCVPTKGRDVQLRPYQPSKIEVKKDGRQALYSTTLIWLSTDFFKSLVLSRIATPMDAPGAFYVHSGISEDYCRQMVSEVRTIVEGKPKWVQRSRANHLLDCEAIAAAMAYALNVQRIPEGVQRQVSEDAARAGPPRKGEAPLTGGTVAKPAPASKPRNPYADLGRRLNR